MRMVEQLGIIVSSKSSDTKNFFEEYGYIRVIELKEEDYD